MKRAGTLIAAFVLLAGPSGPAAADVVWLPGGARVNVKLRTMVDLRFKNVVRQTRDVSCGAAAVATLISYYYADPVGELDVIGEIFKFGDKEKIKKDGFSMLELKRYGERKGYVVQGFRLKSADSINKLKIPVLTLIDTRGYNHFVIIKGVRGGQVYIADPAFGNRVVPFDEFAKNWTKVILVFLSRTKKGDNRLLLEPALRAPVAELRYMLDRALGTIRPGPGEL